MAMSLIFTLTSIDIEMTLLAVFTKLHLTINYNTVSFERYNISMIANFRKNNYRYALLSYQSNTKIISVPLFGNIAIRQQSY